MKKMYCPQCGGEIILIEDCPERAWGICGDTLERVDNNDFRDNAIDFYCENDKEHNIDPMPDSQVSIEDFEAWKDKVLDVFFTM